MAWPEQLPSGRWRGGYRISGGEKRYTPDTYTTEKKARAAATQLEEESRELGWRDPRAAARTWGDWRHEWLRTYYSERSTLRSTESMIKKRIEPKWGRTPLIEITRPEIRAWANELREDGLEPGSVKRIINAFSSSLSSAVDSGVLPANPALRLKLAIPDNLKERTLTIKEQHRLFSALDNDTDRALVAILLGTGCRWGEAVGLYREHLRHKDETVRYRQAWDASHRTLTPYTKGKKRRTVPMSGWLMEVTDPLRKKTPKGGYLFASGGGQPIDYANWQKRSWLPAVKAARLNEVETVERITIHTLRHTYATEQLDAGLSLAEIATLLGHASITTTERYAHRRSKVRAEAATAIRDPRIAPPKKAKKPENLPANVIRFPGVG